MQHDLDQQIDDLKAWQKLDLQECYKVSGSNSDECRLLKDRHAQDLQGYRDERAYQMANCRGYRARGVAAVPSLQNSNNDSYNNYCINHGKCVQYPYADCSQYDRYIHDKLHHYPHHDYSDPTYGGAKPAYAGKPSKPSNNEAQEYADKGAKGGKRDAGGHNSAPGSSTQSALRSSDRDTSSNHGSGRDDSPPKAASGHNHDNGGTSNSSGSHASSSASHTSGGSSSSAGSSSGGHPSGGGGSAPSSGSSSSGAGHSSSASSGNSAASTASSTASPASSASHDSGGSHPH